MKAADGLHPLLHRQLARLGLTADRAPERSPDGAFSTKQWGELLTRISVAYTDADNDRYTLERSIDVSGGEMTELYEQLRSREAFTRAIVESAGDAIITTDETGVLTSFNPAAERLFGWTAAQACGQRHRDRPRYRPRVRAELAGHIGGRGGPGGGVRRWPGAHQAIRYPGRPCRSRGRPVRQRPGHARPVERQVSHRQHRPGDRSDQRPASRDPVTNP